MSVVLLDDNRVIIQKWMSKTLEQVRMQLGDEAALAESDGVCGQTLTVSGELVDPTISYSSEDYERAIQSVVDAAAKKRSYADGNSLATYANSTNQSWAAEAEVFIAWRDSVWGYAYTQLSLVQSGKREQPTVAEILAEIEANAPLNWPE